MSSPVSEPQGEPGGLGAKETLSVLLVEDNPGDARLFEEYLSESPVEVDVRHEKTLRACIGALVEEKPDVLALDLGLPDSEGAETVKAAAAAAPEVPIVVLTGDGNLQAALQAQEAGAAEYLQKEELTPALAGRTLRWALRQRQMQEKLRQRDAWIRSITESISAGVFRVGATGRIEYANEALAEMLGFESEEELIGRDLTRFYADPTDRGKMLADEGTSGAEVRLEGQNGEELTALLSAEPAYDQDGKPLRYDGTITDITGRAKRKKRLRMLSEAVGQAKESVLITEAEPLGEPGPRIEYVNAACEEMTGYSEEELIGKTPRVLQGPETDRGVLDSLREALEAGESWQGETVNYRKDGEPYRVQWNVAPVKGEDGSVEHWVSVQRDVTEERERERALTQMAQALDQIGEKVFITDRDGQIQYVNEAFEDVTGYSEEEVLGRDPSVLRSGEQSEDFYEELWATITSGETFQAELVNEKKDGTRYVEDERISPMTIEEGEITHFVASGRDITRRKEQEERLRRTANLLRLAGEMTEIGGWSVDLRGGQPYEARWTRTLYDIFALSPEEDPPVEEVFEYYHPEDRPRHREAVLRAEETGEGWDQELRLIDADGKTRWVHNIGHPVEEGGQVVEIQGAIQNITDQKRRERELVEAKEEAERASRLKSALLANMSHEIRTPLTSILGFAEAIGEEVGAAEEAGEVDLPTLTQFSSLIEQSGRRLMDTLTGVLNLSKLEAGEMDLSVGPVDLATEAREAAQEFAPQAEEAGIGLQVEGEEGPVWARADEGGVQIALRNLLSNAIKYTGEGGAVWVRAKQEEEATVALEVEDTGIGMDPGQVEELFEPFKQASEGIGREYEGTGLGLALVRRVTDEMGGTVEVDTEKGEGTRVAVRFPLFDEPVDD